jgi:hypothetical protein
MSFHILLRTFFAGKFAEKKKGGKTNLNLKKKVSLKECRKDCCQIKSKTLHTLAAKSFYYLCKTLSLRLKHTLRCRSALIQKCLLRLGSVGLAQNQGVAGGGFGGGGGEGSGIINLRDPCDLP